MFVDVAELCSISSLTNPVLLNLLLAEVGQLIQGEGFIFLLHS